MRKNPEQILQEWFASWLFNKGFLFCASCGGMRTSVKTAKKMKAAGYKRGFPDMQIFKARGGYHGLLIELKIGPGVPSPDQKKWRDNLIKENYFSVIMPKGLSHKQGQDWLIKTVNEYMALPDLDRAIE